MRIIGNHQVEFFHAVCKAHTAETTVISQPNFLFRNGLGNGFIAGGEILHCREIEGAQFLQMFSDFLAAFFWVGE